MLKRFGRRFNPLEVCMKRTLLAVLFVLLTFGRVLCAYTAEADWIDLSKDFSAFQKPTGQWFTAESVQVSPDDDRRLAAKPGQGILVNGKTGRTNNLITRQKWGDLEVHVEFMIPRRSNAGIKLHGVYEIQIYDSWQASKLTGADCGGIYPRGEMKPRYHHLDDGIAPLVNACRKPGEWQTLDICFRAPRLSEKGEKIANAQFEKVLLNDTLIHDHAELKHPTGNAWQDKEHATGPLLLQADHGPVAFRNIRVRPMTSK
jgi:hypothetical protein